MTLSLSLSRFSFSKRFGAALVAALIAPAAFGQLVWSEAPRNTLQALSAPALAYDTQRGVLVLFGGTDEWGYQTNRTWEWNGSAWRQRFPLSPPSARGDMHAVYDARRGRVVMFGGRQSFSQYFAETWEWDGSLWTLRTLPLTPSARYDHAMAYDSARGVTVLHGGLDPSGAMLGDTWEYDGAAWTPRPTLNYGPLHRNAHAMAYDSLRARTVLFGGLVPIPGHPLSNELWEWDGVNWTARSSANAPSARFGAAMAFDASTGRMHLTGGDSAPQILDEHWMLSGNAWTLGNSGPGARQRHRMAFVGGEGVCALAGYGNGGRRNDLTRFDGARWREWPGVTGPVSRAALSAIGHRGDLVLFGGAANGGYRGATWLWEHDEDEWRELDLAISPPARANHAMAHDARHGLLVLFGGTDGATRADTWTFDGTRWSSIATVREPGAREEHALSYDAPAQRVMLFGGRSSNSFFRDTWVFSSSTWTEQYPAHRPSSRAAHALALEESTGRTLLFGGIDANGVRWNDTWSWDGTDWTELQPAHRPGARAGHTLTWDAQRDRLVLFGGETASGESSDCWEWNGADWIARATSSTPSARTQHAAAFDVSRGALYVHGGESGAPAVALGSTHWLRPTVIGGADQLGIACRPDPRLEPVGAPCLGAVRFGLDVTRAASNAPVLLVLDTTYQALSLGACTLYVPGFQVQLAAVTSPNGDARFALGIPVDPLLRGGSIDAQALVFAPGGPLFGALELSAARRIVIGD